MVWTTPTQRTTGTLITASIYNTDIIDNIAFLKGQAGAIDYEDDITPDTDLTHDVGTSALRWAEGWYRDLWGGAYMQAVPNKRREMRVVWEDDDAAANHDVTIVENNVGAGGDESMSDGSGIQGIKVDLDQAGDVYIAQKASSDPGWETGLHENGWTPSKDVYARFEFSFNRADAAGDISIGLRDTLTSILAAATEDFAVLEWDGTNWRVGSADSAASENTNISALTADTWYVLEIYANASKTEFWLNGVLLATHTTRIPANVLYWQILGVSGGGGTAGQDQICTFGEFIFQEDAE